MNAVFRRGAGLLSLAACLTATAAAAPKSSPAARSTRSAVGKHLLQYKFTAGEVLRYNVRHSTKVRTTIDGTTQEIQTRSESVKAWKVTDVLPSGQLEFVNLVESVRMTNESDGRPANVYDSRTDATPPRGFEQAAAAVGVPLSIIRMAPTGEVVSREQKHPQPAPTEDLPITLQLPKEPIAVGEKWNRAYDVTADRQGGAKQQIRTRRQCRLRQVNNGVAVIDVSYEILSPVDSYVRSQLVERLTTGVVRFDISRGRILEQQQNVDRRVLGFAGRTSSMHFLSRLDEELLTAPGKEMARVQPALATDKH